MRFAAGALGIGPPGRFQECGADRRHSAVRGRSRAAAIGTVSAHGHEAGILPKRALHPVLRGRASHTAPARSQAGTAFYGHSALSQ